MFGHADKPRATLEARINGVLDFVAAASLHELAPELLISCVLLEDLQEHGPFAPIFLRHTQPGVHVNWLGQVLAHHDLGVLPGCDGVAVHAAGRTTAPTPRPATPCAAPITCAN